MSLETLDPVVLGPQFRVLAPTELSVTSITFSGLWTGEGPPGTIVGATVGDEYLDALTGNLYQLLPGD